MGEKRKRSENNKKPGPGERGATQCPAALAAIAAKQPLSITWNAKARVFLLVQMRRIYPLGLEL